jgi:hypothetical protein
MAEPKNKKASRTYLVWTNEMDTALLSVLVDHHNRGDHAQNGWKPHVYNACIKHVKETCNIVINKDKIVARIKTFDKHYEVINKMLSHSGFGWDWDNNMVSVDSDEVWARYVEVCNVLIFCNLTMHSFELEHHLEYMCILCRQTRMQLHIGTKK